MTTDIYRIDDEREHIRRVQGWLRRLSGSDNRIPEVFIDGIYGAETQNAVREFQKIYGFPVTGELDQTTFDKIFSEYSRITRDSIPLEYAPEFQYYERGKMRIDDNFDDVYLLQLLLRKLSVKDERFFTEITGRFNPETEKAVRLLQSLLNLPESGEVDIPLWNSLIRLTQTLEGYV